MHDLPGPDIESAWTRLVRAHTLILSEIELALKKQKLPSLSWYDALLEIERVGEGGLRPKDLERRLLLPQYGTSRLLARLEAEGLVTRLPCPDDARGHRVAASASGKALRAKMWPVYAQTLHSVLGEKLTPDDARNLSALLARVLDRN